MLTKFFAKLNRNKSAVVDDEKSQKAFGGFFSTDYDFFDPSTPEEAYQATINRTFQRPMQIAPINTGVPARTGRGTMDNDECVPLGVKQFANAFVSVPAAQVLWYGAQSFIGYQMCAIMAQHWLVDKACTMPAKDAIRKGYEITINDGEAVPPEVLAKIRKLDKEYGIIDNAVEFVRMGRVFGIRVAIFEVESDDPDYYYKPFNPDSIKPGTYRGISQIDPYWIIGQLDNNASANPASKHFYEPTWWQVGARRIHRSHIAIFRTGEVADILKPTYLWGGVSVCQRIYERVYAAERIANEAPLLSLSKRTDVVFTDLSQAQAQGVKFIQKFQEWVLNRNNYGIKVLDKQYEDMKQFDISLTDLDNVIMTQYQLVAAAADTPAVKLLGTSPKGFNTTGEFEESSYHETLESLQMHDITPLLEGHYLRLVRSDIEPTFKDFDVCIKWKSLDALTAKEEAEINQIKAATYVALAQTGAIDAADIREILIADPASGFNGLESGVPEPIEPEPDDQEPNNNAENSEGKGEVGKE